MIGNGRIITGSEIARGGFGRIHLGLDTEAMQRVVLKLEDAVTKHPQLLHESEIYTLLQGGRGMPRLHWFGKTHMYRVMAIELLRPSLEDLFNACGRKFSLKTVLMLADQLIDILEYIHSKGVLHRDIKPENFLMGSGNNADQVHAIDFGLAGFYKDLKTGEHIALRRDGGFVGTLCFASIHADRGYEQGRQSDIESLGYVLMYFLRGRL